MRWFWAVVTALLAVGLWIVLGTPNTKPPAATPPSDAAEKTANSASPGDGSEPAPTVSIVPSVPDASAEPRPAGVLVVDNRAPSEVVERIDERTLELDHRFRITGNGSAEDPYRITWELLTSANAYIDPTRQALQPPPWIRLLDGTYIEISGYYSTAIRVPVAKNLLLTLNRWDGCCIGLPPTPFDAIDLSMRVPLPMAGLHAIRFGTFRGRLAVSAFEAGGFLLGLYRLDDATFETK